jgi:hypothetical protein
MKVSYFYGKIGLSNFMMTLGHKLVLIYLTGFSLIESLNIKL